MGVEMIATAHQLTADLGDVARLALAAGVDSELPRTVVFGGPLEAGLESGQIDEAQLDATVGRVLQMKFRLGLFADPFVEVPSDDAIEALTADETKAARDLAERSMVLVKNDGLLPLAADLRRVAVVGPIADSARDLLGDYSHLVHMETLSEMQSGVNSMGIIGDGEVDRTRRRVVRAPNDHRRPSRGAGRGRGRACTRYRDLHWERRGDRGSRRDSPALPTSPSSSWVNAPV